MWRTLRNSLIWLPEYLKQHLRISRSAPQHVFFCICDHFEPYNNRADSVTAFNRIRKWVDCYPAIVEKFRDSSGNWLKYSFFYPQEEYTEADINLLATLCRAGYGEVEVHLHHDNDTSDNLRRTLLDFKNTLHEKHGLLSRDAVSGNISYGFIHGNWALDNSRKDGRWCGVNDEITILQETGCYADFTLPSAPSETQTSKINSIYYATDDPTRPKSHNSGHNVKVGGQGKGLLMVQGPLGLNWQRRKIGILPTLENGGIYPGLPVTKDRVRCWLNERVRIDGVEDIIFIKIYNHGAFEEMSELFLKRGGLATLLSCLTETCAENNHLLHFVTAREMVNVIRGLENGQHPQDNLMNYRYILSP
jgi:hypothetical protein